MNPKILKTQLLLHLMLLLYSAGSVCSKLAAKENFFSPGFLFYYGCVIVILGIYAIGWQQVIKRMPLTVAYANRAITIVWGLVWGTVLFGETITWNKLLGSLLVVIGVILFAKADEVKTDE